MWTNGYPSIGSRYGWMDGLPVILRLFISILVISGRLEGDNERLYAIDPAYD